MDETAPAAPSGDSATSDAHRPQAAALPKEYGMFTSDGMAVPEPASTAKAISDGAEALGMSSTLPTTDTARVNTASSQAGLPAAITKFGGPMEEVTTTTTTEQPTMTTTTPTTRPGWGNPSSSGYAQPELRAPYSVNLGNTTTHPDPSKVAQEAAGIDKGRLIQGQWNHVEIAPRSSVPTDDASGAFGGPEILKSVLESDAREGRQPPTEEMLLASASLGPQNQRPAESAAMRGEPAKPQDPTSRQADLIAAEASNIARAKLHPEEFRTSKNPNIQPETI